MRPGLAGAGCSGRRVFLRDLSCSAAAPPLQRQPALCGAPPWCGALLSDEVSDAELLKLQQEGADAPRAAAAYERGYRALRSNKGSHGDADAVLWLRAAAELHHAGAQSARHRRLVPSPPQLRPRAAAHQALGLGTHGATAPRLHRKSVSRAPRRTCHGGYCIMRRDEEALGAVARLPHEAAPPRRCCCADLLATVYATGRGVALDCMEAARLWRLAAQQARRGRPARHPPKYLFDSHHITPQVKK